MSKRKRPSEAMLALSQAMDKQLGEEEEESKEETDDVFASFKSYNQSSNDKVQKDKTELTRNDVVCDKANKYLHRGKLKEANFGKKNEKGL